MTVKTSDRLISQNFAVYISSFGYPDCSFNNNITLLLWEIYINYSCSVLCSVRLNNISIFVIVLVEINVNTNWEFRFSDNNYYYGIWNFLDVKTPPKSWRPKPKYLSHSEIKNLDYIQILFHRSNSQTGVSLNPIKYNCE